jgi:hypothetical protein
MAIKGSQSTHKVRFHSCKPSNMMKLVSLLSIFFLLSIHQHKADAFTSVTRGSAKTFVLPAQKSSDSIPDHDDSMLVSRRNAMRQGATAAMVSLSVASSVLMTPDAALADIYDDKEKERKAKAKEDAEGARNLVPAVLFGGTALSVPFFLPNLIRLAKKLFS